MTLLAAVFAAAAATVICLDSNMKHGTLALMYWGASLMWFVNAVTEYTEVGAECCYDLNMAFNAAKPQKS